MSNMNLIGVLEGLLFVVGDEGLTCDRICEILEISMYDLKKLIEVLGEDYKTDNRGIRIDVLGNRLKLVTKKEHSKYYEKLVSSDTVDLLSQACLETLAIVAYNQPITRLQIDEIRGVNSVHLIRKLLAMNMIQEAGKSDLPGRPNLYRVTSSFLDYFGLATLDELPKIDFEEVDEDDLNLFESRYSEKK